MLWDLVKFKIKATFGIRKTTIISLIFILFILFQLYYFYSRISISSLSLLLTLFQILTITGVTLLSMLLSVSIIDDPFIIQKSDVDFLYMLPIDERDLAIAHLISSILINLVSTIFVAFLLFPALSFLSLLVVLMVSVMAPFAYFAFRRYRKITAIIIGAWMLSSILKFPFSPLSMVFGYIYGYFILAGLFSITVFIGLKNANLEDLMITFYKRRGLLGRAQRTSEHLYSSSPFISILKKNLTFVEIGGKTIIGGTLEPIVVRMKFYKVFVSQVIFAVIYYVIFKFYSKSLIPLENLIHQGSQTFLEGIIIIIAGFFVVFFNSIAGFANEPLWSYLSTMTPVEFARRYLLAKTISLLILFLPISISLILLNPVAGLGSLLIPFDYIYMASIYARHYQVLMSGPTYRDIRSLIANYLIALGLLPIVFDVIVPIVGAIVTVILILPFLLSKGYWEKTFEKTITSV